MRRDEIADLTAFLAVAEERNFTRAAAKLGVSQSALSQTVRRLEERLGSRLLARTTRSVALTEAGERMVRVAGPALAEIDNEMSALGALGQKPSGTIRINSSWHAAETILWPAIRKMWPQYPQVTVELTIDQALTDIVAERFDAGVRLGEQVAKDMIAVRIGPELRMAVVGSPAYFEAHPAPATPQDLTQHNCINVRMSTSGGLHPWEFERDGRELNVRVAGKFVFNDARMVMEAALAGFGLALVVEGQAKAQLADGRLVSVLDDWCPSFAGYHLYYPSRRQLSAAFTLFVDTLRHHA